MTESEARDRVCANVSRGTVDRLDRFVELLLAETSVQNLISPSSAAFIWQRHILDSAQLLPLAPPAGRWMDIGSGAGLPGMVIAILGSHAVSLIEPRRLRAEFLVKIVDSLELGRRVSVQSTRVEQIDPSPMDVISARAVAPLDRLLAITRRFAVAGTVWILPKGRTAREEVASARRMWHADIEMIPSVTSPDSTIVVARGVRPR